MGSNNLGGGSISLYNKDGKEVVGMGINKLSGGAIDVRNKNGIALTRMGAAGSDGRIDVNNDKGKKLVGIGAIKDRSNGIINIYNYKGKHRSYTAD